MDTLFQSFHDWRDTSSQSLDWFFKENQTAKNNSFYLILVAFERSIYELGECLTQVAQRFRQVAEDSHARNKLEEMRVVCNFVPVKPFYLSQENARQHMLVLHVALPKFKFYVFQVWKQHDQEFERRIQI